jgi:CheY-like chemotaxis protein
MMDGTIDCESKEGKGSTFWFTAVFQKQLEGLQPFNRIPADIRGKRILVVDQNATNRLVVCKYLEAWECRYDEAPDGKRALALLQEEAARGDPFQIALIDMHMTEMDGETLGGAIKSDKALCDTILIMLTFIGQRGDVARLKAIGFSAYLTKPVKQSLLHDCLVTVISAPSHASKELTKPFITRHTLAEDRKRKIRILVVEDDQVNKMVALRILEKLGYGADAVSHGKEALVALERTPYDLVLMEVQLPVMDGFETTRMIRDSKSRVQNPDVPIIAMTAHAMKGDRERCLEAGMDDYVSKPVQPQELVEAIEIKLSDSA